MTKFGLNFNYSIGEGNFSQIGDTCMGVTCFDGSIYESGSVCRDITSNGKDKPDGIVIVLFSVAFLILLGMSCYFVIYSIGHFLRLDFSVNDLAYDFGVFFMIVGLLVLEEFYLGNISLRDYLIWFVSIGGILLVLVPIIAFLFSIFSGNLTKKRFNTNVPRRLWK